MAQQDGEGQGCLQERGEEQGQRTHENSRGRALRAHGKGVARGRGVHELEGGGEKGRILVWTLKCVTVL